jgi:hypothetical protein
VAADAGAAGATANSAITTAAAAVLLPEIARTRRNVTAAVHRARHTATGSRGADAVQHCRAGESGDDGMRRLRLAVACAIALTAALAGVARADFPYPSLGGGLHPYSAYHVGQGTVPGDISGDGNDWKFASTPETSAPPNISGDPMELNGVRGAHLADSSGSVHAAWETTTGRPDVTIAVLDSGIKWNDSGAMNDLRRKVRLNRGELPIPETTGPTRDSTLAASCPFAGPPNPGDPYDVNGDGVFNIADYACDPRIDLTAHHEGPPGVMTPQDVIVAFSNGTDQDHNGFVDDIAGWDFLDNDNDPFDDVQYGHGTGEAADSSSEANNGGQAGACPNCTVVPLRVGDSFVADVNNFAQAALYATDNGVLVIQEALGTLNHSTLGQKAIDYAYNHGVAVIASAADEAAQHHNWPSSYAHTIVVNSVRKYATQEFPPNSGVQVPINPERQSYLQFNGCTNFSTHVTLAIPSSSCSSNATGLGAGMAGIVYSAAMNANDAHRLARDPNCTMTNGQHCVITANEVRQLMASGTITPENPNANAPSDTQRQPGQADDINFTRPTDLSCQPVPTPGCTDPNRRFDSANTNRPYAPGNLAGPFRSYPAHKGFDQFYGYGRVNMVKAAGAADAGQIPPSAEITSPSWYQQIDPAQPNLDIKGQVGARTDSYTCTVEVAPGSEPDNDSTTATPPGDFLKVASNWCDGTHSHSTPFDGTLAQINLTDLEGRFPPGTNFNGREPQPGPADNNNNRPNPETYGFTVRVVVTSVQGPVTLQGQDRRNFFLHRDQDTVPGFPKELGTDGASSPALADIDGDNRNEVIFGTSDGEVHAMKPDGTEAPGWPVHVDPLPLHTGGQAFTSGEVSTTASREAILASPAVGDIDHDGVPEVVVADFAGHVYVFNADGTLKFEREADPAYSGKPLQQFVNVRQGVRYRTQHGFFGSPVLANLDNSPDGKLDIIAANMDRHVYAWHSSGTMVAGFPVTVVDRSKITAIDPVTNAPTFKPDSTIGNALNQGAIVTTPAVGDITGDGKPEIIVGTNEEYPAGNDGGFNASGPTTSSLSLLAKSGQLNLVNSRVYAIKPTGDPGGPDDTGTGAFVTGWPVKVGDVFAELLPVVGEGVTGSPIIGTVTCTNGGAGPPDTGPKVGAMSVAGPGYIFNSDGSSCYGKDPTGVDNAMATDVPTGGAGTPRQDTPAIPAVGQPAFGNLDPTGLSFLAPAAGVLRALDLGLPEYQGGQDFSGAWNASTGQFHPGFPSAVNDLSFLTGPSAANVDNVPGDEVLSATASLDLNAMNAQTGAPADPTRWPKLTGDWVVANPLVGSFGQLETDSATHNRVIEITRAGTLFAFDTPAPACPLGSWPRFHHDNASSGDFDRDAVAPGVPSGVAATANEISFTAPGDDLLCGTAAKYEVVQSDSPINAGNFEAADPVTLAPAVVPAAAGTSQRFTLPAGTKRYVAFRAVDDQNNAGRTVSVDRSTGAVSGGAPGPGGAGGASGAGGGTGGAGGGGPGGSGGGGSGGAASGCTDRSAPHSSILRRAVHASRHALSARGGSRDGGCPSSRVKREYVSLALVHGSACRFVTARGRLTGPRRCRKPVLLRARGTTHWSLNLTASLPPGRYRLVARGVDAAGNKERPRRSNSMHVRVR